MKLNLFLFGEDSGGAAAEGTTTVEATGADAAKAAAAAQDGGKEQGSAAAAKASFDELIKGDYKEDYDKAVQRVIDRRFKTAKASEERLKALDPAIRTLADRYGVDASDADALVKAIAGDNALIEEKASGMGLTVEQYRQIAKINYENEVLRAQAEAERREASARAQYEAWQKEAEEVKGEFPDFDLEASLKSESFQRLLRAGTGIKAAYIATNADAVLKGAMQYTAQTVAQKTADTIAARGSRPTENGLSSQASARVKTDVGKLSDDEMIDFIERASKGEVISFSI